mmetsp:Transcript_49947/g.150211  ORF Transcript_49947/g.150211 Transcript_49947/m.150211 type:complete len:128 (-) Transcript_49947:7-390(-)
MRILPMPTSLPAPLSSMAEAATMGCTNAERRSGNKVPWREENSKEVVTVAGAHEGGSRNGANENGGDDFDANDVVLDDDSSNSGDNDEGVSGAPWREEDPREVVIAAVTGAWEDFGRGGLMWTVVPF